MKTVKVLNILSSMVLIIWVISVIGVVIGCALHISILGTLCMPVFALGWIVAFALGYEASELETKIVRGY